MDKSLEGFSFELHYLDHNSDIQEIGDPNVDDILFAKCYPKWDISEEELTKLVEQNKEFLFSKLRKIAEENHVFYSYFDIDYSSIYGTSIKLDGRRVMSLEIRPEIHKKKIDGRPTGFISPGELPPEV